MNAPTPLSPQSHVSHLGTATQCANRPQTTLEGAEGLLRGTIEAHQQALGRLADRLDPVMRPSLAKPPSGPCAGVAPEPMASAHVATLRQLATELACATDLVTELLDRLEA